ncbi:MAG: hypothetical protein NT007_00260, partial [Candidatus Kapabacteria bacterium]|nr:hypothetical protein [Candidatus Kapabacteria bacterium]
MRLMSSFKLKTRSLHYLLNLIVAYAILQMPAYADGYQYHGNSIELTAASGIQNSYSYEFRYRDRIEIKSLPNQTFEYDARSTVNGFHAFIDRNVPLSDVAYKNHFNTTSSIDRNLAVGKTNASYSVTPTGAFIYQIPIFTSPGTNGIQPQISIVYNSQGGNGELGFGFGLSGLSAISRVPKNFYFDNESGGVDFSSNDRFALDGQRLILLSNGNYGDPSTSYGSEVENFSQITTWNTNYGNLTNNPFCFTVITKDGKTIEYGKTVDSRITAGNSDYVICWKINKITDANGNYMIFNYNNSSGANGESWLKSIEYTGNTNSNILPYNKIEFFYDKRKDINQSFIAGYSIPQTVLLTKVVVSAENQLVKTYDLNYYLNHYSQLVSVQETGADGQKLNPIEIKWTENLSDLSYDDISRTANDFPVAEDNSNLQVSDYNGIIYGDFNGDSKTDYIVLDENLQTWKIYSNANGSYSDYTLKNSGSLADIVRKYEHQFRHKIIYANSFASDVDNDGKTDLILCLLENDENQDQNGEWIGDWHPQGYAYLILFNIGTNTDPFQFSFQDHVNTPTINRSATYQDKRMVVGNFLGTKHFQIFIYNENGDKGNLLVYDEQYRCFNSINYNPDLNLPSEFSQLHIEDNPNKNPMTSGNFLGKGKTELLLDVYGVDNLQNSYNKFVVYSINLNGGNLELVRKFEDNRTLIHKKVLFGDFNGDGKTDILALTNHLSWGVSEDAVNIWKIYFGKGTGFDEVAASSLHLYLNAENPATNICNNNYIIQTGDFNGDGKTDVVQITKQSFGVDRYIHLSYGYGFKTIGENLTSSYFDSFRVNSFSFIGDINGDGNLDLILEYDELCANFYENNTRHIFSSIILKDEESQHVSKIFDGLENYTEIKYDLMNRISLTFPHLMSNNILEASYPMYLVTNVKEYYGYFISTTENQYPINYSYSKIDYTYSTPCFHQLGKGFLGFAENTSYTHIFDENNTSIFSRYTSSQNQLNTDYTVLLPTYKAEKINPQSEPLNTASTSYSFINLPNNRYFIKSSNEVLDYFNYSKKTSNINYYDESAPTQFFGNVSSQEEEYSKLSCQAGYFDVNDNWHDPVWSSVPYAHSIVNYNAYMKPANFLYPSFPSVVVQTKKFVDHTTESDYSRKLSMEYYDNGNLKTKISDPDFQDLTVKTEYVYNNFGNIISQTLSAPSAQPSKKPLHRTITSQYDTYGRFELIKTDAAGVSIKGFYDPKFGQVTFKYDPNNLVTQYFYDGFGRNIKTISADGAESSQEISFIPLNGIVSINSFLPLTQIIKRATNAPEQVTYFDSKGRDLSTVTTGYDNKPVAVDKFYDKLGRQNKTTEPYFKIPNPPSMYHTPNVIPNVISYSLNEYDEFGRVIRKNFNTYDHENSSTTILQTQFSYNNAEYSITTTLPDGLTSKIVKDILGNTIKTYDTKNSEKNFVEHAYYNSGKVRRSTVNNINGELSHVDFEYDLQGNQTKLIDQDAGTTSYEYDAFGQLILQTNARNLTFQLQYDVLGRVTKKYWPIENGTYPETNYYYVASGPGIGLLQSVIAPNQASTAYQYDIYGRQIQIDERVPDGANFASFSTKYEYRDHGREKLITYPSGLKIFSSNNANTGLLDFINLGDNSSNKIYLVTEIDNLGRINRANLKSILNFEKKYDDFGFLREISTAPFAGGNPIQYENYVYNIYNGDLISRNLDPLQIPSKNETFVYDNLDRLITITYGVTTQTVDYHDNGNILSKGGIGTYSYNIVNKTHAVSGIDDGNNTSQISQETQNIQYTSFDKISSISEGMNSAEFIYGTDNERRLMTTT